MVHVAEDIFGTAINPMTKQAEQIKRFTLANGMSMRVQIITLGATITGIQVPDANGHVDDIVLGYDNVAGYQTASNPYFGATVGRVCNRIANGRFPWKGQEEIQVSRNLNNKHQLHGGFIGFDKVHWQVEAVHQDGITLKHHSPDGHEGYPGQVTVTVIFTLTEDNCLHVQMQAETTETTVVNMTNHSYFNLAGHNAGQEAIFDHSIMIMADKITETNEESIPTGNLKTVAGSSYDLRKMKNLGEKIRELLPATNGFDDNFCIEANTSGTKVGLIAKAYHPKTGRWLEIASDQPGVQFYTANFLPDTAKGEPPLQGKNRAQYAKQGAFCLETQKYPDAVNHPNFPSIILKPGERYNHEVIYKFGACGNSGCQH